MEKLHHLKSSLTGDAANLIRQFAIQGKNFAPAWATLQKRFGNKKLLLHSEMDRFMSTPKATSLNIESVILNLFAESWTLPMNASQPLTT